MVEGWEEGERERGGGQPGDEGQGEDEGAGEEVD